MGALLYEFCNHVSQRLRIQLLCIRSLAQSIDSPRFLESGDVVNNSFFNIDRLLSLTIYGD